MTKVAVNTLVTDCTMNNVSAVTGTPDRVLTTPVTASVTSSPRRTAIDAPGARCLAANRSSRHGNCARNPSVSMTSGTPRS